VDEVQFPELSYPALAATNNQCPHALALKISNTYEFLQVSSSMKNKSCYINDCNPLPLQLLDGKNSAAVANSYTAAELGRNFHHCSNIAYIHCSGISADVANIIKVIYRRNFRGCSNCRLVVAKIPSSSNFNMTAIRVQQQNFRRSSFVLLKKAAGEGAVTLPQKILRLCHLKWLVLVQIQL